MADKNVVLTNEDGDNVFPQTPITNITNGGDFFNAIKLLGFGNANQIPSMNAEGTDITWLTPYDETTAVISNAVTQDDPNPVSSGAVYDEIDNLTTTIIPNRINTAMEPKSIALFDSSESISSNLSVISGIKSGSTQLLGKTLVPSASVGVVLICVYSNYVSSGGSPYWENTFVVINATGSAITLQPDSTWWYR